MGIEHEYIDVSVAIIQERGKILITQRTQTQNHPMRWEFPGGKLEHGEPPEDCLRRELLEELNIEVLVGEQCLVFEYDYKRPDRKIHRFFSFWCIILAGRPSLKVHQNLAWVEVEELVEYDIIEADRQLVEILIENSHKATQ